MKKVIVTGIVLIIFVFYAIFYHKSSTVSATPVRNTSSESSSSSVSGSSSTQTSGLKDGTYTGSAADAFYGNIQVKATVQDGKLTDVQFLQSPSDQEQSIQINEQADPILAQEAIQKQSANVDIVSGATQSSEAFQQSLADALSQAK